MKKMLLLPMLLASSLFASAQTNPNIIDFEPGTYNSGNCGTYSQAELALVDNEYFQCAYGVTFHMGSLGGTPPPTIAEVGDPRVAWGSSTTFSYYSPSQECSVATNVNGDKPTNNKDVGCFFITDDGNGPGPNPDPLYVDYHDLECTEASGFLMDVDGNLGSLQEGWEITAVGILGSTHTVYVLSPDYINFDPTPPTPQTNIVGGDGEASYWAVDLGTDPIDYIKFSYIGHPKSKVGLAFDEFAICSKQIPDARGCCDDLDEENLIVNGSFEMGNFGFSSGYTNQPVIAPNSVTEGMYAVVTSTEASTISNCWRITNHTTCDTSGKFMVVNGRTHNPPPIQSTTVYSQSGISVEKGEEYIFCMYYQHLPQCAFDVFDPQNLQIDISNATLEPWDEEECPDNLEHCGWTKISYTVTPTSNTIDLSILLDEGGIGDGNDVAFDDFSLRKKGDMPTAYCAFDISSSTSGTNITITATAVTNPLPAGFDVEWTVTEADSNTWAPIGGTTMTYPWDPDTTNFSGYCCVPGSATPGAFSTSKCYIITRKVTNCCYNDCEYRWYLSARPEGMVAEETGETTFYISNDLENWEPVVGSSTEDDLE